MKCWRCHSNTNSVNTGRSLSNISDVMTRNRRNHERQLLTKCCSLRVFTCNESSILHCVKRKSFTFRPNVVLCIWLGFTSLEYPSVGFYSKIEKLCHMYLPCCFPRGSSTSAKKFTRNEIKILPIFKIKSSYLFHWNFQLLHQQAVIDYLFSH